MNFIIQASLNDKIINVIIIDKRQKQRQSRIPPLKFFTPRLIDLTLAAVRVKIFLSFPGFAGLRLLKQITSFWQQLRTIE